MGKKVRGAKHFSIYKQASRLTNLHLGLQLSLNFDFIFSSLINSVQKQEKSALERLKSSQELDKTDEISMALWYSVLQVVLYPLLGLIMRGICYGSFLQEVVQIVD